jgi:hypothetical protein
LPYSCSASTRTTTTTCWSSTSKTSTRKISLLKLDQD